MGEQPAQKGKTVELRKLCGSTAGCQPFGCHCSLFLKEGASLLICVGTFLPTRAALRKLSVRLQNFCRATTISVSSPQASRLILLTTLSLGVANMKLNGFPTELLSEIFGHLQDKNYYTLGKARLVCRQWNSVARRHMYQTVSLQHYIAKKELFDDQDQELAVPDHHGFRLWTAMAQNEAVRQTAQAVKIHSGPNISSNRYMSLSDGIWDIWLGWEHDEWKEFQDAIARVADFPALNHVHILFPTECGGLDSS